jgi:hypothetical protein
VVDNKFGVQASLFDGIELTEENMKAIKRYNRKHKDVGGVSKVSKNPDIDQNISKPWL